MGSSVSLLSVKRLILAAVTGGVAFQGGYVKVLYQCVEVDNNNYPTNGLSLEEMAKAAIVVAVCLFRSQLTYAELNQ